MVDSEDRELIRHLATPLLEEYAPVWWSEHGADLERFIDNPPTATAERSGPFAMGAVPEPEWVQIIFQLVVSMFATVVSDQLLLVRERWTERKSPARAPLSSEALRSLEAALNQAEEEIVAREVQRGYDELVTRELVGKATELLKQVSR